MDFNILKQKKENGELLVLDAKRKKEGVSNRVLSLLKQEALSREEIQKRLNISLQSVYNVLARLEKKNGLIIALDINGKTYYVEKEKAKNEGLL
ncbi:MAG: helix-turn-helix domain-containing protein [Candidatus Nanoarchaeia archaeon]|nr:helix-turn-helix domain-containing protein [Candidatus Nanoarchaeia archaeon]